MSKTYIGLTGGLGSGKSTAAHFFQSLGIETIDADVIVHQLLLKPSIIHSITQKWGRSLLDTQGKIDHSKLRAKIFTDPKGRASKIWLEKLLHPLTIKILLARAVKASSPICILVIPLLFEARLTALVDKILVIDAPQKLRIARFKKRTHLTMKEIQAILKTQISRKERLQKADYVIKNTGSVKDLEREVRHLAKTW